MSPSKLKTWLYRHHLKPQRGAWRNFKKYGNIVKKNNRLYRFRMIGDKKWVVDISEPIEDFDRWANSREFDSVPFELFEKSYVAIKRHNFESLEEFRESR